jgi:RNA polymerase sigma factor (sigma-70 family)
MALDFLALFEAHYDEIAAYLKRRQLDRSIAEDLAQETFAEAFRSRATYDEARGDPRPWLFGIAANLLRHHRRREAAGLRAYARAQSREVHPRDDYDELCDQLDASGATGAALAGISQNARDVLTLHYFAELSYVEIATALEIPIGTVASRLSNARREMRAELGPRILGRDDG